MKTSGLGRGLDAIFVPGASSVNASSTSNTNNINNDINKTVSSTQSEYETVRKISVNLIDPNPYQPRIEFEREALEELKKSILQNGLIQPVTIRKWGERYQLISGERRLRSFMEIGYKEIPAYIIKVETDEMMLALALIENLQREKLNIIEVANAYKRLIDECSLSQEQVAERVGKDRTTVANTIRLLKLPQKIKDALASDEISAGHARALININNERSQLEIFEKIKSEHLSVRKVEQLVQQYLKSGLIGEKPKSTSNIDSAAIKKDFNVRDFEDKIRKILGTKISINNKKDGSGEINIQYFSYDEFERIFELFDVIQKNAY